MIPTSVKILALLLAVTAEAQATASACEDCAEAVASDQTELLQQQVQTHSSPAQTSQHPMFSLLETEEDDVVDGRQSESASDGDKFFPGFNFPKIKIPKIKVPDLATKAKDLAKQIEEQNKKKAQEEHAVKRAPFMKDYGDCKKDVYPAKWFCQHGTFIKLDSACSPVQPGKRLPYAEPSATSPTGVQCLIDALMDEECGHYLQIYDNGTCDCLRPSETCREYISSSTITTYVYRDTCWDDPFTCMEMVPSNYCDSKNGCLPCPTDLNCNYCYSRHKECASCKRGYRKVDGKCVKET